MKAYVIRPLDPMVKTRVVTSFEEAKQIAFEISDADVTEHDLGEGGWVKDDKYGGPSGFIRVSGVKIAMQDWEVDPNATIDNQEERDNG